MSLKCTLFGHRFGAPDVERDRDEEGSEVVSTIREIETCVRCGESRVVSENTEVTTLETPEEPAEDPSDEPEPAVTPVDEESPADDAVDDEASEPLIRGAESADEPASAPAEAAVGADGAESTADDGVILEEPPEETEREPGAWPEEPDDGGPDWQPSTDEPDPVVAGPDVEPTGEAVTVPEGTFHCPECGFSTPVEASSLREGDFCPECHTGSLAHQPDDE